MFKNIGDKIKTLAVTLSWIGIFASIIIGYSYSYSGVDDGEIGVVIIGIAIALAGSLVSWISAFLLYGFGQLVKNSDILVNNTYILANNTRDYHTNSDFNGRTEYQYDKNGDLIMETRFGKDGNRESVIEYQYENEKTVISAYSKKD